MIHFILWFSRHIRFLLIPNDGPVAVGDGDWLPFLFFQLPPQRTGQPWKEKGNNQSITSGPSQDFPYLKVTAAPFHGLKSECNALPSENEGRRSYYTFNP